MAQDFSVRAGGASGPVEGGQLYFGKIVSITGNNKVKVNVPMLGIVSQPIDMLNSYGNDKYQKGERVVVGFLDGGKQTLVVLGRLNHADVVFPTYQQYLALEARVASLENASHSH